MRGRGRRSRSRPPTSIPKEVEMIQPRINETTVREDVLGGIELYGYQLVKGAAYIFFDLEEWVPEKLDKEFRQELVEAQIKVHPDINELTGSGKVTFPSRSHQEKIKLKYLLHHCMGTTLQKTQEQKEYKKLKDKWDKANVFGSNLSITSESGREKFMEKFRKIEEQSLLSYKAGLFEFLPEQIEGVNTPILYIKERGCATLWHNEQCNFSSVNFNFGPSDFLWYIIPQTEELKLEKAYKQVAKALKKP